MPLIVGILLDDGRKSTSVRDGIRWEALSVAIFYSSFDVIKVMQAYGINLGSYEIQLA